MVEHAQRRHARYGGSGAARWSKCTIQPDQAAANAGEYQRRVTRYNLEGEKAHEVLHTCLTQGVWPQTISPTDAITFSVQITLDYILVLQNQYPDLIIIAEQYLDFPQDVLPREDVGGTPDIILYSPLARKGWVIDFKHGEGVIVEIGDNKQLRFYATCYFIDKPVVEVDLVVIQPRGLHAEGPIRTETITAFDIVEYAAEVDGVLRGPKRFEAGAHCRWCPLAATCPTRESYVLEAARQVWPAVQLADDIGELPNAAALGRARVGKILELAEERLLPWIRELREFAYSEAIAGQFVPGWKTVEAQSRRKWHGEHARIAGRLMELSGYRLGMEDVMPRELATITDMEERLAAIIVEAAPHGQKTAVRKQLKEALAELTSKESSGNLTLVRDTDKRQATNAAQKIFTGVSLPPPALPMPATAQLLAPVTEPTPEPTDASRYEIIPPAPIQRSDAAPAWLGSISPQDREAWDRLRDQQQPGEGYFIDAR